MESLQHQLFTMEQARNRGAVAIALSADRADRSHPGWVDLAVARLQIFALSANADFTIEQARAAIEKDLAPPPDLRAFGAVTQKAIRMGVIVRTGEFAPAASSHASLKPLYRCGKGAIQ